MSSTQYIKIFNDTVLKQSILQGYETQRTDSTLGKFTMGELAFTRDTGRVFVGTYTDNIKSSDIDYVKDKPEGSFKPGGLLVGNKYYGASKGGTKLTHYPTYNSSRQVYNGDYTFDVKSCSLMLFDTNIKKGNKIDDITLDNKTNDIYNDGFIKMRILEPDNDTIKLDSSSNHNVLKADFTFDRVADYFGNNWKKENEKIEIKNINLDVEADCTLPSNITIRCTTKDENNVQKSVQKSISFSEITDVNKFPNYILCAEADSKDYQIQFKDFDEVIDIIGDGGKIKVEKIVDGNDGNKQKFKIQYEEDPDDDNINNGNTDDGQPTITFPDITQTPWDISDPYYYSRNSLFSLDGKLAATETYGNITIKKHDDNVTDGTAVELEPFGNFNDEEKATLDFIEKNYIGGLFNIGLNYLKNPLASFNTYTTNTQENPTTVKYFSNLSGVETCIEDMYTPHTYNGTVQYPRIIPSHAQSIILQVSKSSGTSTNTNTNTTTNTASVKLKNGATLFETNKTNQFTTTVEVPLYVKMRWESDPDEKGVVTIKAVSYKWFNITLENCDVKLLGYRV